MTPKPLPALAEDPDFNEAKTLRNTFQQQLVKIRNDRSLSQLGQAEAIEKAWTTTSTRLDELAASLRARRLARLQYLEAQVPLGPGIDATTSPADKAVLFTSWRTTLATARDTEWDDLPKLVDDAVKYGDDMLARAALTVALETRPQQTDAIAKFDAGYPGLLEIIRETTLLEAALTHDLAFPDVLWERQVFSRLEKPSEVDSVQTLRNLAEQDAASGLRPRL